MAKYLMLHGFGHDTMGKGADTHHGATTMEMLDEMLAKKAAALGVEVESFQSNDEAKVIDRINTAKDCFDGILFNPASWVDNGKEIGLALGSCGLPVLEVHLGNVNKTDTCTNLIAPHVKGIVSGFGESVYPFGLELLDSFVRGE